jgi:hypothetical protein
MRRCGIDLFVAGSLVALLLSAVDAGAQADQPPPNALSMAVVVPTTSSAAVVVATTATELAVVRIQVPASFPGSAPVNFAVTPLVDGAVVGRLTGATAPTTPGGTRDILFAVRSPRQVAAGEVMVAQVRFSTATAAVEIPVIAQVATIRRVTIAVTTRLVVVRAGTPAIVGYRLANLGNAPDTVTVQVVAPTGWRVPAASPPIPLAIRGSADHSVLLEAPPDVTGAASVRLVVLSRGRPVAEEQLTVQVAGGSSTVSVSGPTLRAGFAAASGPWDGVSDMQSIELQGLLSDGVSILARGTSASEPGAAHYAFSRANLASTPFFLQLAAPEWRVDAGTFGTTMSDLAGVNLVGRGASAAVRQPLWNATAVAATPDLGYQDATGTLAGTRVEYTPGAFALSTALTHLRESRGLFNRELDAWSLGGQWNDPQVGRWSGELARRRVDGQAVPGWSASYDRRTPNENIDIRYVHAPGGSRAFARASSELAVNAGRRINSRLQVTGGGWRTSDDGAASLTGLTMEGWTLGAHVAVDRNVNFSVRAHQSAFGASTAVGDFGSAERALEAELDIHRGSLATEVTVNGALLRRHGMLDGDTDARFTQDAPRAGVRAMLSAVMDRSTFAVTGQYDCTGSGIGAAPVQWAYGIRMTGTPAEFGLGRALHVDAAAERVGGSLGASRAMTMRAGVELDLPQRASVRLSAERNPWILPEAGGSAWMYVVGVSKAISLPSLASRGTKGVVYRDLNGSGRRDAGETGMPGVALRRGTDFTVTDSRGAFLLEGNEHEPFEVDARSLPLGWILPSTVVPAGTRQLGAVPVSSLTVTLALDAADTARVPRAELAHLVVIARDSTGREWMSRSTSDSTVVFDALPPGAYSVVIDASATREPLRPVDALRPVIVTTGRALPPLRVVLRARPLRFSSLRLGTP